MAKRQAALVDQAVAVRSYHPDRPTALGLSYAAVVVSDIAVRPEAVQTYLRWLRASEHGSS